MGAIPTTDARALFTKMLVDVYTERARPTLFLQSFFAAKEGSTKNISIEVQRGTEKVAVSVTRGTEGNRNTFSKSTEKIFTPEYYREYFDATELDLYDRLFGSSSIDAGVFADFTDQMADRLGMLQDKIERAYELQCAAVLLDGIITNVPGGYNIDFKRKADSLLDLGTINSNRYWTDNTNSTPHADLETACNFIRQKGKSQGAVLNAIMGSTALNTFLGNTKVTTRADIRNYSLDNVAAPQRNSVGASLHGQVSVGAYQVNLWSYPQFYDNASGVSTPYVDPKKVIILPEMPRFVLAYAAVPQIMKPGAALQRGKFVFGEYPDERNSAHIFDVKSAGLAVPVAVDQMYTVQVVA
jgi:hypothetical protein